jgi:hypothetical protein
MRAIVPIASKMLPHIGNPPLDTITPRKQRANIIPNALSPHEPDFILPPYSDDKVRVL